MQIDLNVPWEEGTIRALGADRADRAMLSRAKEEVTCPCNCPALYAPTAISIALRLCKLVRVAVDF